MFLRLSSHGLLLFESSYLRLLLSLMRLRLSKGTTEEEEKRKTRKSRRITSKMMIKTTEAGRRTIDKKLRGRS